MSCLTQLNELLDLFAGKLRELGNVRLDESLKGLQMQVANLTHLLYLQERNIQFKEAVREREHQVLIRVQGLEHQVLIRV